MDDYEFPYVLLHRAGPLACGGPAFRYREKPQNGDLVLLRNARHLDGSPVDPTRVTICDTCGGWPVFFRIADVVAAP